MSHALAASIDNLDIAMFANTAPPPPYREQYDLTPLSQSENRPRLPEANRNPNLVNLPDDVTIVKFQTIVREGREIVVGRIKVPTFNPTFGAPPHAFILRRYDTNAISLTTMFKVAFPGASEEDEKREMDWVKSSYDTRNTNGGRGTEVVRLAGQWVSRHLAIHLAPAYGMTELVSALARAVPDPNVQYRKSQRSQQASDDIARSNGTARPVPSLSADTSPPAAKRQRRSPAVAASDSMVVDGEDTRHLTIEATTTVTAPTGTQLNMEAEINSAKQLVKDLKRELRMRSAAGEEFEEQGGAEIEGRTSRGIKRGKDATKEAVVISGGSGLTGEKSSRVIVKNSRVDHGGAVENVKKFAWGAVIFGLGVGAATFIPQFASSFL